MEYVLYEYNGTRTRHPDVAIEKELLVCLHMGNTETSTDNLYISASLSPTRWRHLVKRRVNAPYIPIQNEFVFMHREKREVMLLRSKADSESGNEQKPTSHGK